MEKADVKRRMLILVDTHIDLELNRLEQDQEECTFDDMDSSDDMLNSLDGVLKLIKFRERINNIDMPTLL